MKKFASAFAAILTIGATANADPAQGLWQTHTTDSGGFLQIDVNTCGSKVCGTIIAAYGPSHDDPNIIVKSTDYQHLGKKMIWDMTPDGDGFYSNGKIWDPESDKTYKSKMTLNGRKLDVSGCFLGFCKAYTWKKK